VSVCLCLQASYCRLREAAAPSLCRKSVCPVARPRDVTVTSAGARPKSVCLVPTGALCSRSTSATRRAQRTAATATHTSTACSTAPLDTHTDRHTHTHGHCRCQYYKLSWTDRQKDTVTVAVCTSLMDRQTNTDTVAVITSL